ncbi:MAG: LysR family transcriptional regulator [Alphaproteobacteria bacterium]|nr:LysR family transcriptional regulator [Alphaproteobacteria bacterium]
MSEGFIKTGADQKISPDVWEDLRVLLAFARAGTIAKCAELLGVTQPTVIRKLAALEAEMDRRLLVRSTRGSSLTQEGEKLVALADQIDRQVATALNATSIDHAEVVGNVRVSCTDGLLSYWLAPRVEEFKTEFPSVSLELYSTNEPPQLERREVDVVCSFLDFQSANILSRRVGFVHLVPFVSKSFVQQYGMPPEGKDWSEYPIVDHVAYRDMVAGFADWMKLTANSQMKYVSNNSTTYYHLVRSGLGIGFLGNYAALDPELLPIPGHPAHTMTPLYVGALRVLHDDPSVSAVVDWVHQTFDRAGDPWFRKDLIQPDSMDLQKSAETRQKLESLLVGQVMPQKRPA